MAVVKQFNCEECSAIGKITMKTDMYEFDEILYCPVCGYELQEEDDEEDEY